MPAEKWTIEKAKELYQLPFTKLILKALTTHTDHFPIDEIEMCALLSFKTGNCPEDCGYCTQSGHYQTDVIPNKIMPLEKVIANAKLAKANGAIRFCMGAAWRNPPKKDFPKVLEMIKAVKELGLETCVTLGMLDDEQAKELKTAGLDFYNHNLDTSANYYNQVITTRTYQDRLDTLNRVNEAGIHVCCGGILGMGETSQDRIELLVQLANLPTPPKSVPINKLIPFRGTPLENSPPIDNIDFVRTIAVARIMLPDSYIRLSAGRISMSQEMQTLCFLAGANSMWVGDKLLTAQNPDKNHDLDMLEKLGMRMKLSEQSDYVTTTN